MKISVDLVPSQRAVANGRVVEPETAEQRGMEMMMVPMNQLPPLATKYAKELCARVGMCAEVLLTAWTIYAQCVEGLSCTDDNYKASSEDFKWFHDRTKNK